MAETIDAKVLDLMLNTEGVVREGDEGTLQVLPVAGIPYIKAQSLVALLHGVEINGHVMTKGSVAGQTTLSYQKLEKGKLKEPVHSLLRVGIAKTGTGFTSEYSYTTFVHPDHVMVSLPSTKVSPEHVADFLNKFAKGYAFDAFPRDQIDNESLCAELLRAKNC